MENPPPDNDNDELETLEGSEPEGSEPDSGAVQDQNNSNPPDSGDRKGTNPSGAGKPPKRTKSRLIKFLRRLNIYLLLFILIVVVGIVVLAVAYFHSQKSTPTSSIGSQNLSQQALEQLANSDATVGNPKQILNVQSNAVFAGNVLVRDNLEVAGKLQLGGSLSLAGIQVAGDSQFDQVEVNKNLSVTGNTSVQGQETVSGSLQVGGGGTFGGALAAPQISVNSLQLNGNLTLTHHLVAGGPIPGTSTGSAVGGGGSASLSGSDTAGTVNINTGGSPPAGCFINVNFTQGFQSTPHVVITPVGSAAAGLEYYVNRSASGFSICTANGAPGGSSFAFDYIVFD